MQLNITLLGQMITFIIFVLFTMKYVWPPITSAMRERQERIADGLAAAEKGKKELEQAQTKVSDILNEAKIQASQIVDSANKRAMLVVDEAKERARLEAERIIEMSRQEAEKEFIKAKQVLKQQIGLIAMQGAEKILGHHMDEAANTKLIEKLITEL